MQIEKIDENTYVGPQIDLSDITEIKRLGFGTIIVVRPDGESEDQVPFSVISEAAGAADLYAYQIAVIPGKITNEDVLTFGKLIDEAPKPVFSYCRTGTRAAMLWALNESRRGRDADDLLRVAKSAGHNLSSIAPRLAANGR